MKKMNLKLSVGLTGLMLALLMAGFPATLKAETTGAEGIPATVTHGVSTLVTAPFKVLGYALGNMNNGSGDHKLPKEDPSDPDYQIAGGTSFFS